MTSWAGDGRVVETSTDQCPSCGAPWPLGKAGNVRVGSETCHGCSGARHGVHRSWCCLTCGVETLDAACDKLDGARTVQRLKPR